MKRKEMLKLMVGCFRQCKVMRYSDEQAMDRVLEICEENGMKPPTTVVEVPIGDKKDSITFDSNTWDEDYA